jgi:RNA polymerase sigma-70 factor (ECF subfamily)
MFMDRSQAFAAVESIRNRAQLDSYYLLYAVLGELESRRSNFQAAAGYFRQALELTQLKSSKSFYPAAFRFAKSAKTKPLL